MASKVAKVAKAAKKSQAKINHPPFIKTTIKAGMASPAPPLGPQLGQRGINVAHFCREFNDKTAHIVPGCPMPCRINVNPDRTYKLTIQTPEVAWLVKRAAGIRRGAMDPEKEIAGKITLKHVYEIAKVKIEDEINWSKDMPYMCRQVIHFARRMGVEVVRGEINPEEYRKFLEERKEIVKDQMKELEEKKAAKMQRTPAAGSGTTA